MGVLGGVFVLKSGLRILIRAPQVPFLVPPKTPKMGKGILEQYRPALEILGLLHVADGGGIIHCQTFRSSFVEIHNVFLGLVL